MMPDALLQEFEDLRAIAAGLNIGMNGEVADHRAVDFIAEGAAGADQPAAADHEHRIFAVSKGLDDLVRRPLSQGSRLVEAGQLFPVVEG